jgi:osmotically-inducible protein OsmY
MNAQKGQYMKTLQSKACPYRTAMSRWSSIMLVMAIMQTPVLTSVQAAPLKKEITDGGISFAVVKAFAFEKGVFPNDVDVTTTNGIVTLSGSVDNILAKDRAAKIAESIRGVIGVINRVEVLPVSRSDEAIRKDILSALMQNPATESYQVSVSVDKAIATLSGSVGSYAEQQLVEQVAKEIKGVKEVSNGVAINYLAKRTDAEIAADIASRLRWDIWINGGVIKPVVNDGKVTLTGTVGSEISELQAVDDAWVNGVSSVDSEGLKIDPHFSYVAQKKDNFAFRPDSEIKQAILAAFSHDPRIMAFSPDVTVEDGAVTLFGSVGNAKAKAVAGQDAMNIWGVWHVDNFLRVRMKMWPSDEEMLKQLKAALSWNPLLDSSKIDVAVINRVAYLSGVVDTSSQKMEAENVASQIKGVIQVRNRLSVEPGDSIGYYKWPDYETPYMASVGLGPPPFLSDAQIKKNIEDAFFWSPFVHRSDITVTVEGGVATLTGTVGTSIGYNEADKDARHSGAAFVRNKLKIKGAGLGW